MGRLVRTGHHMGPMYAVLKRYGIGVEDKFNRGLWIQESDLPKIKAGMALDPTRGECQGLVYVNGTNMHNQVIFRDFEKLFTEPAGSDRL